MNIDKNALPFNELEGDIWTNFKPKWQQNNPNCRGYHYSNNLFPDTYYFQHMVSPSITNISEVTSVQLRKVSDNTVVAYSFVKYLYGDEIGNKYLIIKVNLASDLIGDKYYISTTTAYNKYYSEIFCVTNIKYDEVGIVWASTSKVGNMIYKNDFKHKVNIKAKIVPLPTEIEEETEEDGFGSETPTFQKLTQSYFFSAVLPNYLAQALSAIPLHNQFKVIDYLLDESGTESFDENITKVEVKVTPEDDSCHSFVEVTYQKELILKTACDDDLIGIGELVAFNHPPVADIAWNDFQSKEDRNCSTADLCEQTVLITDGTYDMDGNIDTMEWERSDDEGETWTSSGLSSGMTKIFTETEIGTYWYRLKVTDTQAEFAYSNILKYVIYNLEINPTITFIGTSSNNCAMVSGDDERGKRMDFDINGLNDQNVRLKYEVIYNVSYAFTFKIFDRNTDDILVDADYPGTLLGTGSFNTINFDLSPVGLGEYYMELCMIPNPGEVLGAESTIRITLYNNDNVTLSEQTLDINARIRR